MLGDLVQVDLHTFLQETGRKYVIPGSVIKSRCKLNNRVLYFAVSTDEFSQSSVSIVERCLRNILECAKEDRASTIAIPQLGTGYGRLRESDFRSALQNISTLGKNYEFILTVYRYKQTT